jgi:signal transduction histidine kinase
MANASELLLSNKSKIMKNWEERANNEVLAAFKLESLALRDSLPELLSQISTALSTTIDRTAARVRWDRKESLRIGQKHGHERAVSQDYTMDQMIFEYHILREVICDVMEEDQPLSPVEREVIVCAIEQSVNDAATQFSETLRNVQERLASTLTHDLRGPIVVAKMTAQLILRKPGDADNTVKSANRICESMDRLDSMIHDLLDASVIRAGERLPLKVEEFDLNALIEESADEFNIMHGNRVKVVMASAHKGFWSKSGIRRILDNLVTNAVKYGDPNTPITITLGESGSKVILSVHNEGKAIPVAAQSILFQPFRRIETEKMKTGWGLGLTVVKGVTEAHGGIVRVESLDDVGTTFIIELPIDAREALPTVEKIAKAA